MLESGNLSCAEGPQAKISPGAEHSKWLCQDFLTGPWLGNLIITFDVVAYQ